MGAIFILSAICDMVMAHRVVSGAILNGISSHLELLHVSTDRKKLCWCRVIFEPPTADYVKKSGAFVLVTSFVAWC